MKLSRIAIIGLGLLTATSAFALNRNEAGSAKQNMSRCQYNDAVCVGNVLIDAMTADGQGNGPGNGNNNGRQKMVVVYGASDSCSGSVLGTVIMNANRLQESLEACNRLSSNQNAWSISVDGRCTDIPDTSVQGACIKAINL